ncbi:hypothetical protein [Nitrosovibrio sp. Nv17]|uniref:hypothetical protein n=1 Tax=Nitrosovibrio sp. Nv17 TaxID=1855339 RepID=UPI0009087EB1|nr:hypothetical protein [Nitrosovibrio sp. Nv17]SFW37179.1 hypothetical protein SAMN05216414_12530 [Nitrosovibrio sp. Nv17]
MERSVTHHLPQNAAMGCISFQLSYLADHIAPDDPRRAMAILGNHAILFHVSGDIVRIGRVLYGARNLPGILEA